MYFIEKKILISCCFKLHTGFSKELEVVFFSQSEFLAVLQTNYADLSRK